MTKRAESLVMGLVLGVVALGAALMLLELPWFTRLLSARHSEMADAVALPLAEASRRLVVYGDEVARSVLSGFMTPDAVVHLDDVRRVIAAANLLTLVLAATALIWVVVRGRRDRPLLADALRAAAVIIGGSVALAVLVATLDFDSFFSAFHGLFFEPGTWTFPSDSVLIRLFPEPFWTSAGLAWGVLTLGFAGGYLWLARAVRRREARVEAP